MPAKIKKQGNKWIVWNPESGKIYGTHKNRPSALSQLRALYANVPEMSEGKK